MENIMMMNREAREELYDPGWNKGRKNTLWNRVNKYSRSSSDDVRSHLRRTFDPKKLTCEELTKLLKTCRVKKTFDPASKHKRSAWLFFVIAHKNMRTKKGLLDLRTISKLWKLKKAKERK